MSPLLGAHRSTAGGRQKAFDSGMSIGCGIIQVFTSSPRQWAAKPLTDQDLQLWYDAWLESSVEHVVAHDSYLINLAAADEALREKSRLAFTDELRRCQSLGITQVVMHPGAPGEDPEEVGLERIAAGLKRTYEADADLSTRTLLETTAGQGSNLGHRFEHLADLLQRIGLPDRTGVCLDTCHVFAAGYDLRTPETTTALIDEFDAVIGLSWLKVLHLNDSKGTLGSRVDRHEQIGQGEIGDAAFRTLLRDPRLVALPKLVETPDLDLHGDNLKHLRRLARGASRGSLP